MRHHFFVKPDPPYAEPVKRPLRALSAAEQEMVAGNREKVRMHMPELVPFIMELHAAGMIDGWRSVAKVTLLREAEHGIT